MMRVLLLALFAQPALACPAPTICFENDALVERLGARSSAQRQAARRTLRALGAAAIPALLRAKGTARASAGSLLDAAVADVFRAKTGRKDLAMSRATDPALARFFPGYRFAMAGDTVGWGVLTPDGRVLVLYGVRESHQQLNAELGRTRPKVATAATAEALTVLWLHLIHGNEYPLRPPKG